MSIQNYKFSRTEINKKCSVTCYNITILFLFDFFVFYEQTDRKDILSLSLSYVSSLMPRIKNRERWCVAKVSKETCQTVCPEQRTTSSIASYLTLQLAGPREISGALS